jgi:hypothetical protein
MYESMLKRNPNFHLYIFPFDDLSEEILRKLSLEKITIVALREFEDETLLSVKPTRSKGEYCWTCTPAIIYFCIKHFGLSHCTYIDADLYFFSNPNVLVDEMGTSSILITEHRYTKRYDKSRRSGIYCVQFVTFKNDQEGILALTWWKDRCLEWCFARVEDGKFGDQKYLDDWPTRFKKVHVLKNLGGGVAPWNVQQYNITVRDNIVVGDMSGQVFKIIFYHFHDVKLYRNNKVDLGIYKLDQNVLLFIYKEYINEFLRVEGDLKIRFNFSRKIQSYLYRKKFFVPFHRLARILLGVYTIFDLNKIKDGAFD